MMKRQRLLLMAGAVLWMVQGLVAQKQEPAARRPEIVRIGRNEVVIHWQTSQPAPTKLVLWERVRKSSSVYESLPPEKPIIIFRESLTTNHESRITNLKPATEYRFRIEPSPQVKAGKLLPEEFAFCTKPPKGVTTFWRTPMLVVIFANVINVDTLTPDAPKPEPASKERISYYREEVEKACRFFWVNSKFTLFVEPEFLIIEDFKEVGEKSKPENRPSWRAEADRNGKKLSDYCGIVEITAEQRWSAQNKRWFYQGSGGGTYGINFPTEGHPGQSFFLGGSDLMWLFVHEVHHQIDSYYEESGYEEYLFNHPAPILNNAFRFGEHYDCNAYILRWWGRWKWQRDRWFFCKFGELGVAKDADGDGIPDDAPKLPFDEKRFGSSPKKKDTDGDGLSDMGEALASIWVEEMLPAVSNFKAIYARPNPRSKDSDGDGIIDGKDPYPIYAAQHVLRYRTPKLDGRVEEGEWHRFCEVKTVEGKVADIFAQWDAERLYFAFRLDPKVSDVQIQTDFDDDGWFVGKDNYFLTFRATPDGMEMTDAWVHNAAENRWPFADRTILKPEDIEVRSHRSEAEIEVEVAIRRNPMTALLLDVSKFYLMKCRPWFFHSRIPRIEGEKIAFTFNLRTEAGTDKWVSAFEPYVLFAAELDPAARELVTQARPWDALLQLEGSPVVSTQDGERRLEVRLRRQSKVEVKGTIELQAPDGFDVSARSPVPFTLNWSTKEITFLLKLLPTCPIGEHIVSVQVVGNDGRQETLWTKLVRPIEWLAIGPFDNADGKGFDAVYPPETEIDPNKSYEVEGKTFHWQPVPAKFLLPEGGVNFDELFQPNDWVCAYALTHIWSPNEQDALLLLGSDDTLTVWHNGKEVIRKNVMRPAAPGQDKVPVRLTKGWNRFLVKVCDGQGGWQFYFQLADAQGKPLKGLWCSAWQR